MLRGVFLLSTLLLISFTAANASGYIYELNQKDLSFLEHQIVDYGYSLDDIEEQYFPLVLDKDHKTRTLFKAELAKIIFQDESEELASFDDKFYSALDTALHKLEKGYRAKYAKTYGSRTIHIDEEGKDSFVAGDVGPTGDEPECPEGTEITARIDPMFWIHMSCSSIKAQQAYEREVRPDCVKQINGNKIDCKDLEIKVPEKPIAPSWNTTERVVNQAEIYGVITRPPARNPNYGRACNDAEGCGELPVRGSDYNPRRGGSNDAEGGPPDSTGNNTRADRHNIVEMN